MIKRRDASPTLPSAKAVKKKPATKQKPQAAENADRTKISDNVMSEWWAPFADYLALERRYSPYTLRNYRGAFEDFTRWLMRGGHWRETYDGITPRVMRDFVIESQRQIGRRTLHNHASGLRAFYKFWQRRGRVDKNPLIGLMLPKLEKRLPQFLTEAQMKLLLLGPERCWRTAPNHLSPHGGTGS